MKPTPLKNKAGFTLVEAVIAAGLAGMVMVAVGFQLSGVAKTEADRHQVVTAEQIHRSVVYNILNENAWKHTVEAGTGSPDSSSFHCIATDLQWRNSTAVMSAQFCSGNTGSCTTLSSAANSLVPDGNFYDVDSNVYGRGFYYHTYDLGATYPLRGIRAIGTSSGCYNADADPSSPPAVTPHSGCPPPIQNDNWFFGAIQVSANGETWAPVSASWNQPCDYLNNGCGLTLEEVPARYVRFNIQHDCNGCNQVDRVDAFQFYVATGEVCSAEELPFELHDSSGNVYFDPTNESSGFTKTGQPCNTFSPEGNDDCPFSLNLTWQPLCQSCSPRQVLIRSTLRYAPGELGKKTVLNPDHYSTQMVREFD